MATNPATDLKTLQHLEFPGEGTAYRTARNRLLAEEMELRRQVERVALLRRAQPRGGEIKEDYVFERSAVNGAEKVKMSGLFVRGKDTLGDLQFHVRTRTKVAVPWMHAFPRRN
jgi:predicted dithiol-disulfide oxidoreductase (DUF899 family)